MTDEPGVEEGLSEDYWDEFWEGVKLPASVSLRRQKEMDHLINLVDYSGMRTAVEVGCAPGRWMAYFNTRLGLESFGIEYAEASCRLTRKNLELLGVPGHVYHSDFLAFDERVFDVVFSAGVIEHFPEPENAVKKLAELCTPGGCVITAIPSFAGINPWISKTFRPTLWAGHYPISLDKMVAMHEAQGLETV